jgi:hypothetical protein
LCVAATNPASSAPVIVRTQAYYHSNDRQAPIRTACDIVVSKQASAAGVEKIAGNLGIF